MSGKKARKIRNILKRLTSKASIPVAVCGLTFIPMRADADVIFSVFPHYMRPLPVGASHDIQGAAGAGLRLTYRPNEHMNFFVQGDYLALSLPNVDSINVLNGSLGAGYRIPIGDRLSLNMNMSMGSYYAKYKDSMTSISGEISLSLEYKLNPIVSAEVNSSVAHYNAGETNLITGAQFSPGISLNMTQAFGRNAKIKIEQKRMDPVFPVLYSWYEKNSFGAVTVENKEDASITNVSVKFFQPQYMSQPNECASIKTLKKGETANVDLTAFFNERMLDLLEMTDTQATVTVEYEVLGMKKSSTLALTVPVCGRNSMSWDDDRRAAVFVSSKDPAAMWYSKLVSSVVRNELRNGVPENIQYAMGIFDTLDEFGINYVIDPTSSYADNVGTTSIDFLQFPYQTLMYRGGDCDDLSILISSLFEAVGIPTAFITIPGHIFMAFDSGVAYEETKYIFSENDYFINHDGEAWIPVEITLTDEGFSKAWRTGAREWRTAEAMGTAAFYATHDSWKLYKPVSVPGAAIKFSMVEEDSIAKIYKHSIDDWIAREISDQVDAYLAKIEKEGRVEDINALGVLYGRYGLFDKAEGQLKVARRQKYLPAILNTANVYYTMKEFALARQWYEYYLESDPDNALALLGISKCSYELEDYKKCDEAFTKVIKTAPTLASNNTYLGAFENTSGRAFSLAQRLSNTVWIRTNDELSLYQANPLDKEKTDDSYLWEDSVKIALAFPDDEEESEDENQVGIKNKPKNRPKDEPKRTEPEEKNETRDQGLAIADLNTNAMEIEDEEFEVDRIVGLENQIAIPDTTFILSELGLEKKEVAIADEQKIKITRKEPEVLPRKKIIEVTMEKEQAEKTEEIQTLPAIAKTTEIVPVETEPQITEKPVETKRNIEVTIKTEKTIPNEYQQTENKDSPKNDRIEVTMEKVHVAVNDEPDETEIQNLPAIAKTTEIVPVETEPQATEEPKTQTAEIQTLPAIAKTTEIAPVESEPQVTEEPRTESTTQIAKTEEEPTQKTEIANEVEKTEIAKIEEEPTQETEIATEIETEIAKTEVAKTEEEPQITERQPVETKRNIEVTIKTEKTIPPEQAEQKQTESKESPKNDRIEVTMEKVHVAANDETDETEDATEVAIDDDTDSEEFSVDINEIASESTADTEDIAMVTDEEESPEDMSEVFDIIWDDEKTVANAEASDMSDIFDEIWDGKTAQAHAKKRDFEKRDKMAKSSGIKHADIKNLDENQLKDVKYAEATAEENEEPQVIVAFREVPRFSETATSKWATEDSYKQDFIPGMKSYEEELGISDDKNSWKNVDNSFLRAPDNDVEVIAKPEEKKTPAKAISFLDEEEETSGEQQQDEQQPEKSDEKQNAHTVKTTAQNQTEPPAETVAEEEKAENFSAESSEQSDANRDSTKNGKTNANKKSTNIEKTTKTEALAVSEKQSTGQAQADDKNQNDVENDHHWLLWIFLGCGIIGFFIFFLLFWKRDDDEDDEEGKKNQKVNGEESK